MRAFRAGARLQLDIIGGSPDYLMEFATAPLFTLIFLMILRAGGREDLSSYAVLAPILILLWRQALTISGEVIDSDRWFGTLEPGIGAPAPLHWVVTGRISAVSIMGLLGVPETWLVAYLFGSEVSVHHPVVLVLTVGATILATTASGLLMSTAFVATRSARTFQNSLSYPFYVLGGVLVPVSLLPDWVQPLSRVVFLSWSADLLRDSLQPASIENVSPRLIVILLLAGLTYAVGRRSLSYVIDRARSTGTVGLA
jgi:ABC-2 type transport system permease protein